MRKNRLGIESLYFSLREKSKSTGKATIVKIAATKK